MLEVYRTLFAFIGGIVVGIALEYKFHWLDRTIFKTKQ
jgi:hypothetical protein